MLQIKLSHLWALVHIIKLYFRLLVCPVPVFPVYPIDPTLFLKAGEETLHPVPETLENV